MNHSLDIRWLNASEIVRSALRRSRKESRATACDTGRLRDNRARGPYLNPCGDGARNSGDRADLNTGARGKRQTLLSAIVATVHNQPVQSTTSGGISITEGALGPSTLVEDLFSIISSETEGCRYGSAGDH